MIISGKTFDICKTVVALHAVLKIRVGSMDDTIDVDLISQLGSHYEMLKAIIIFSEGRRVPICVAT